MQLKQTDKNTIDDSKFWIEKFGSLTHDQNGSYDHKSDLVKVFIKKLGMWENKEQRN